MPYCSSWGQALGQQRPRYARRAVAELAEGAAAESRLRTVISVQRMAKSSAPLAIGQYCWEIATAR